MKSEKKLVNRKKISNKTKFVTSVPRIEWTERICGKIKCFKPPMKEPWIWLMPAC